MNFETKQSSTEEIADMLSPEEEGPAEELRPEHQALYRKMRDPYRQLASGNTELFKLDDALQVINTKVQALQRELNDLMRFNSVDDLKKFMTTDFSETMEIDPDFNKEIGKMKATMEKFLTEFNHYEKIYTRLSEILSGNESS